MISRFFLQLLSLYLLITHIVCAQSVVINKYHIAGGNNDVCNQWTQLLVIDDNVDMRGWTIRDYPSDQINPPYDSIRFENIPLWNNLRAGTVIVLRHRCHQAGAAPLVRHPDPDPYTTKPEGYIIVSLQDSLYNTVPIGGPTPPASTDWKGYFTGGKWNVGAPASGAVSSGSIVCPTSVSGNNSMVTFISGEIIELRDAANNSVHALAHQNTAAGPRWTAITSPKLNHAGSLTTGRSLVVCPGGNLAQFNGPYGTAFTNSSNLLPNITPGFPSICGSSPEPNVSYWQRRREPAMAAFPQQICIPYGSNTFTFTGAFDPLPTDQTQGYSILRSNCPAVSSPFADSCADGIEYAVGATIGSWTVIANIDNTVNGGPVTFTDPAPLPGLNFYRVFPYRYSGTAPNRPGTGVPEVGRGRAYNQRDSIVITMQPQAPATANATPNTICSPQPVALSATGLPACANARYAFFDAAVGGTEVGSNPTVTATTTFYAAIIIAGCTSATRTPVTVNFAPLAAPTVTSPINICAGQAATIAPTGPAGVTFRVYTAPVGGVLVGGPAASIDVTPAATTTYYVESYDAPCFSTTRTAVTVNVAAAVPVTANPVTPVCVGQSATLSVTTAGTPIEWYTVPTGGTPVGTGSTFTTPPLTGTTTYYVIAGAACASGSRTAITATVLPSPAAPTVNSLRTVICLGERDTLRATGGGPAATYAWYDADRPGGSLLGNSNPFATPVLTAPTTFWCETIENGCTSATRTSYRSIPTLLPAAPVPVSVAPVCVNTRATIAPPTVPGLTFLWFSDNTVATAFFTGTAYTTSVLSADTTIWYASLAGGCSSSTRTAVTVSVKPRPVTPTITDVTICQNEKATLTLAAGTAYDTIFWYTDATTPNAFFNGLSYTTSNLAADTTLWYAASLNGCVSAVRNSVKVIVSPLPTTPTAPVFANPFCVGSSATVTLTPVSGENFRWFADSTTTTVALTGNSLTINNLPANDTMVFVQSFAGNCSSARMRVRIPTVLPPDGPAIADPVVKVCSGSPLTLSAPTVPPTVTSILWYLDTIQNLPVATGASFNLPAVFANTTLWIGLVENGCTTFANRRTAYQVEVIPLPAAPTLPPVSACQGERAAINLPDTGGISYNWYANLADVTPFFTGNNYTTGIINTDSIFYIELVQNGCTSATRSRLLLQMLPGSKGGIVTPNATICAGVNNGTVNLVGQQGSVIKWQVSADSSNWTDINNTGTSLNYSNLLRTAWYRAVVKNNSCADSFATPAKITVLEIPNADFTGLAPQYCITPGAQITLSVVNSPLITGYNFFLNGVPFETANSTTLPAVPGNYTITLTVRNGICESSVQRNFSLFSTPDVVLLGDSIVCAGSSLTLRAQITGAAPGSNLNIDFGDPEAVSSGDNPYNIIYNTVGNKNISLSVISNNCSSATITKTITVKAQPIGSPEILNPAGARPELTVNTPILKARANAINSSEIIWNLNNGSPLRYGEILDSVYYTTYGRFPLTVQLYNEDRTCSADYNLGLIDVFPDKILVFPSGFSPNGDNNNEFFNWRAIGEVKSFSLMIFNRWGELVYESENVNDRGWDGKYNGGEAIQGTYTYVAKVRWKDDKTQELKGTVVLFR